jgi:Thiamine pyrophosphate enzyme, N-terminal TPP binding domain
MAAFEAVGYAKFTGRVGVCMATSGPGAIHLLKEGPGAIHLLKEGLKAKVREVLPGKDS